MENECWTSEKQQRPSTKVFHNPAIPYRVLFHSLGDRPLSPIHNNCHCHTALFNILRASTDSGCIILRLFTYPIFHSCFHPWLSLNSTSLWKLTKSFQTMFISPFLEILCHCYGFLFEPWCVNLVSKTNICLNVESCKAGSSNSLCLFSNDPVLVCTQHKLKWMH